MPQYLSASIGMPSRSDDELKEQKRSSKEVGRSLKAKVSYISIAYSGAYRRCGAKDECATMDLRDASCALSSRAIIIVKKTDNDSYSKWKSSKWIGGPLYA